MDAGEDGFVVFVVEIGWVGGVGETHCGDGGVGVGGVVSAVLVEDDQVLGLVYG